MPQYNGTPNGETIVGSEGNDTINGNGGGDLLLGDMGNDFITGGSGFNTLYGGMGNDTLVSGPGSALLNGNIGNDAIYGGKGDDTIYGGKGDDFLFGGLGTNIIHGDLGTDTAGFAGKRSDYTITQNKDGSFQIVGDGSTNTVYTVENFQFSDQTISAANLLTGTPPNGGGGTGGGSGSGGNQPPLTPGTGQVFLERGNKVVGQFTTIQAAVDAAATNGDQIMVGAGTFQEQVTDNGKALTITGRGEGNTIITSPNAANLKDNVPGTDSFNTTAKAASAVVGAINGANLTLSGLTIDGKGQGAKGAANGDTFFGVAALNSNLTTTGTVGSSGVDITGVSAGNDQNGQVLGGGRSSGVFLDNTDGNNRTDNLSGLSVENYQKNGIIAYGNGLTLNSSNNQITGSGDINSIAQNGIEFIFGATGSSRNDTVKGLEYTGGGDNATGILIYQGAGKVSVANDIITGGNNPKSGGSYGVSYTSSNGGSVTDTSFSNLSIGIDDEQDPGQTHSTQMGNTFKNVITPTN